MTIRDERAHAMRKIAPLNERLAHQFGLQIDFASDEQHLRQVLEHYHATREFILAEYGESAAMNDPNYAKAVLISEAVRMYLREIAPKRIRRKKKN